MLSSLWLFVLLLVLFTAILVLYILAMKGKSNGAKWGGFAAILVVLLIVGGLTLYANRTYVIRQTKLNTRKELQLALTNFVNADTDVASTCGRTAENTACYDAAQQHPAA